MIERITPDTKLEGRLVIGTRWNNRFGFAFPKRCTRVSNSRVYYEEVDHATDEYKGVPGTEHFTRRETFQFVCDTAQEFMKLRVLEQRFEAKRREAIKDFDLDLESTITLSRLPQERTKADYLDELLKGLS